MAKTSRVKTGAVQVEGLRELNASLRRLGPEFPKQMRAVNKQVATFVAADARGAAYSLGSTAAHVAPSIKPSAGVIAAGVAIGGPGYEMAGGAEFGSARYSQFMSWRGNGPDAGYFLYPAIRQDLDRIETEYGDAVDQLIQKVGLA